MKRTTFIYFLLCAAWTAFARSTTPQKHHTRMQKRYVKLGASGGLSKVQMEAVDLNKRYVIVNTDEATRGRQATVKHPVDISALKKRANTFEHSPHKLVLRRGHQASLDKVKRGTLHPLLYWEQHYNRAMRRSLSPVTASDLSKRDALVNLHMKNSEERMRKRWISIHTKKGLEAPELALHKRQLIEPLIKDSNMFGLNRGAAKNLVADAASASKKNTTSKSTTSDSSNADGFSETRLQAALSGSVKDGVEPSSDGSEALDIEANDVGYFATMKMGTPPRDFKILMDTGSADLWVPSQACNDDGTCGGHQVLGTKTSSTFKATKDQFQVTYGTGNVQGVIASDTISLEDGSLSLANHSFGVNTFESKEFATAAVPFDGLMGLAISTLSQQKVLTYPEALAKAGKLANAQMGYNIASVDDPKQDSQITFGGVDSSKFSKNKLVEFPNVSKQGFWSGGLQGITIDGKAIDIAAKSAILDTGTTLIIAPAADAEAFHAAIPGAKSDGANGFLIPCTTTAQVSLKFGDAEFPMNPKDLLFVPVDQNDLTGDCQSAIGAGQIDQEGSWLLGDSFLKSAYLATDVKTNTIGLVSIFDASASSSNSNSPTSGKPSVKSSKASKKTGKSARVARVKGKHHIA